MKLPGLVNYLIHPEKLDELYSTIQVNKKSEALILFMADKLSLDSEIMIFEVEETGGKMLFEKEGRKYIELFPVDMAIELVESDLQLKGKGYSDLHIANRLLEYRKYDA